MDKNVLFFFLDKTHLAEAYEKKTVDFIPSKINLTKQIIAHSQR